MEYERITEKIIGCAFKVFNRMGSGYLKSVRQLLKIHEAQLVNYLVSTGKDIGLLINFGAEKVQIKRKIRILKD